MPSRASRCAWAKSTIARGCRFAAKLTRISSGMNRRVPAAATPLGGAPPPAPALAGGPLGPDGGMLMMALGPAGPPGKPTMTGGRGRPGWRGPVSPSRGGGFRATRAPRRRAAPFERASRMPTRLRLAGRRNAEPRKLLLPAWKPPNPPPPNDIAGAFSVLAHKAAPTDSDAVRMAPAKARPAFDRAQGRESTWLRLSAGITRSSDYGRHIR